MSSRNVVIGIGLLAAVAASVPTLARSAPPVTYPAACASVSVPTARSEEAHAFYGAGRALYDEGQYDAAIAQFREAYKRDCSKHDLLIIISRSYELNRDRAEAIHALEVFLERTPKDSPEAATHRTKIENLKRQLAAQPPPAPTVTSPPPPPPPETREHTIPPWIVVGVGGVAVVTGTILLIVAPQLPTNCKEQNGEGTCNVFGPDGKTPRKALPSEEEGLRQDRKTAAQSIDLPKGGLITLLIGAGFVGGGLLWHFLEPTGPSSAAASTKPKVTPAIGPGYAGMSLGGSF